MSCMLSLQHCRCGGYQKGPYEEDSFFTHFRFEEDCFDLRQMKERCV